MNTKKPMNLSYVYCWLELFISISVFFSGLIVAMYYEFPLTIIGTLTMLSGIIKIANWFKDTHVERCLK